ncbi:MAG: DedA family protein [Proteobacteria bacterium]|nr:DedA family protein [Pseudomonadota bacterium]MBU1711688.1 DedA family protein [Pseudomonadota bacterium]
MDFLAEYGYIGLFLASFLAATILPLSSEVVLIFLLLNSYDPFLSITVATAGNVLGSVVNYALGLWGSFFIMKKLLRLSQEEISRSEQRFKKYGVFSLLFAWVPIIGDPLTVAAGVLKINIYVFLSLVTAGKLFRYIIVGVSVLSL